MDAYVLILTITIKISNSGMGVAMHEFITLDRCEAAGKAWIEKVHQRRRIDDDERFYLCVKK